MHASIRFDLIAHSQRDVIGIWGDGSLSFVVSCILKSKFPNSKIVVIDTFCLNDLLKYLGYLELLDLTDIIHIQKEIFKAQIALAKR